MDIRNAGERLLALAGIIAVSPVLLVACAAILFEDGGPVLFRQRRVGRHGRGFRLLKLRSMRKDNGGLKITTGSDPRITRTGAFLRRYKLDELPQLWNVVRGEMSLIGPRPEVPDYVDERDQLWREVLSVRPGISDLASLVYRNEEEMLHGVSDPDSFYRTSLLPRKLRLSAHYIRRRSLAGDLRLLLMTFRYSFLSSRVEPERVLNAFEYTEVAK
jgi:lipopolysaccharide/colanic/teichoic acid biosynthesis glycosyltransferase